MCWAQKQENALYSGGTWTNFSSYVVAPLNRDSMEYGGRWRVNHDGIRVAVIHILSPLSDFLEI